MFMFTKKSDETVNLDDVLADLCSHMKKVGPQSEEYSKLVEYASKLYKARETNPSWRPSPDAVITALGGILGIVLILNYEKLGSVTSAAKSFIRLR